MNYGEIFKKNYDFRVNSMLGMRLENINSDNKPIEETLCSLYWEITKDLFKEIRNQEFAMATDYSYAREEVLEKIIAEIGRIPISLLESAKPTSIKDTDIEAFNEALNSPQIVEESYFDILEDALFKQIYDMEDSRKETTNIKKGILKEVKKNILEFSDNLHRYIQNSDPQQFSPKPSITNYQIELNLKEPALKNFYERLQNTTKNYEEKCIDKNLKEELVNALTQIRDYPGTSEEDKIKIIEYINSLTSEIGTLEHSMENLESDSEYCISNIQTLEKDIQQITLKIKRLQNIYLCRIEALKKYEVEKIREIGIAEISAILDNDADKIRIYEILKYHIIYSTKVLKVYYYITSKYEKYIKNNLPSFRQEKNYENIKIIKDYAIQIWDRLKSKDPEIVEYEDIANLMLPTIIYKYIKTGKIDNWKDKFSFWDDYKEYISYYKSFSPIEVNEAKPNGFYSFTQFKRRDKFNSQSNFNDQFNNYRKKFSAYDASVIISEIIKLGDTGLTEEELINPIKYSLYFNEDNGVGGVMFFKLYNDNWLVFSLMGMAFKIKKYTEIEVEKYPAFRDMTSIYTNSFLREAEVALPAVYSDGRPSYVSKNNRQIYPTAELAFTSQDSSTNVAGNKKVANYDNYFKFWEDFYGSKEVVTASIFYDKVRKNVIGNQGKDLFKALKDILQDTLHRYAEACKTSMDESGWLHKAATIVVPFYDVVYKLNTDSEYELTDMDIVSLIIDSVCILFIAAGASIKLAGTTTKSIMHSVIKARTLGITGRKNLLIYAARNTSGLPKEVALILIKSAFDVVNPIPFTSLPTRFPRVSKLLKTGFSFKSGDKTLTLSKSSRAGELKPEWAVNNRVMDLSENTKIPNGDLKNVYATTPDSPYTLADKDYYIKEGGKVYQVEWDDYSHTLRVIDQRNPGLFSYKTPVKWDNGANKWITHSFVPGLGGNPIRRANLVNISEEEVQPLVELMEEARKEALDRVKTVKNALENPTEEQGYYINKAFDMFMGQHSDEVKLKINNILSKQKLALEILDVNKDVIYHTTYHERFANATFHTKPNAFFLEKLKKNEPFINAYVNPIVDLRKINKYDLSQLKEFISQSLIHELHHATNEHAPDHIYASYLNSSYEPKVTLNGLLELTVPHLRSENIFSAKNDTLKLYYYYATQEERIMFGSIKHTAKEAEINQKLKEAINKKIKESDKQVLENPDNLVFLISSLYDAVKNNNNFKRLVIDYDKWFNAEEGSVFWYLKSNDIHNSQHNLRHNSIGELNTGSLTSLTSSIRDYKIKQANPIDVRFEYVIKGPEAANYTLKSNYFADEKALTTTKGDSLSIKTVIEQITEKKTKLDLGKNLNFIKVACNEEQVVGIKILKSDISYGKPLLIFGKKYGVSTIIHAVSNSSVDAYYVSKSLNDSTSDILGMHNLLNPEDIIHIRHTSNSHLTIKQFFILLSGKYNKTSIHFSGRNMTDNPQEILSHLKINNIELFQYDKNTMDSTDNIPFGQSFLLLSKTIDGKVHTNSYSESFDLLKEGHLSKLRTIRRKTCVLM